jgi:hypothetical protein
MSQWTKAKILALIVIFAYIAYRAIDGHLHPKEPVYKPNRADFRHGEILLPDYACSDTLIVINAERLNHEINECDGGDGDIDSILHRNCIIY